MRFTIPLEPLDLKKVGKAVLFIAFSNFGNYFLYIGKAASLSASYAGSSGYTFEAGKAVDGIYVPEGVDRDYASVAISANMLNPWWRVDLGQLHCIWAVNILNRGGES